MEQTAIEPEASAARELMDSIGRIGRMMGEAGEPDRLLASILEECRALLRCESAGMALVEEEYATLRFIMVSGDDRGNMRDRRMPLERGIIGAAATSGEATYTNNAAEDPRWFAEFDRENDFATRNAAAAPMRRNGAVLGVLEAVNRTRDEPFAEDDLRLLQVFADQAAVAIAAQRLIAAKAESDRLAGFGIALADVGHTIKNILMRLQGPVGLLDRALERRDWELAAQAWPVLRKANREINGLVMSMLDYARGREPVFAPVDVAGLVYFVVELCAPDAASRGIALRAHCPLGLGAWPLDASILRPALMNLICNAIEALEGMPAGAKRVTVGAQLEGASLHIWVADNGPGIPEEIVPRLFNPFFTRAKPGGTGLGLANVRKGVEEHGGKVTLSSRPGCGAMFTLILPRLAD